jgi:hypothetical protein
MRKVLARIRQSFHDRPRKMYLAYYKPKFPEIFSQHDFLREVTRSKTLFSLLNPYGLAMYETRDFSSNGEIVS